MISYVNIAILRAHYFKRLFCQYASLSHLTRCLLPSRHNLEIAPLLPGMPATEAMWNPSRSWEGSPWLWERSSSAGAAQGPCRPRHSPAVAVDTSVLQLLHSQDPAKLLPKDRQGLLLSCQKNVTRKQAHTPSPVISGSHLFSSVSESLLQKALLKVWSLQLFN